LKPHESPAVMLAPLVILAGLAVVGGLIQLPFSDRFHRLELWLHPVVEPAEGIGEAHIDGTWADDHIYLLLVIAVVVAVAGVVAAYLVYQKQRVPADKMHVIEPEVLQNAWYYDRAVSDFMGGPGREAFEGAAWFDANVVDGAVNGTAKTVQGVAGVARKAQNGFVRVYAGIIAAGVAVLLAWFVVWRGIL